MPANDPEIEHKDAALRAIEHKLRYETRLGSGGVNVYRVEINESETTRVRGWPRYRTEGKAGIAYFGRGGFTRTTRRFEVLTEEKAGAIRAVDVTVK